MEAEQIRDYALAKAGAKESFPFGTDTLVIKVGGKIFLLISLDNVPLSFNAKQNPEKSETLREHYEQVLPGWHMNKTHWNTVVCSGLKATFIKEMIDDSYHLVVKSLPKRSAKKFWAKERKPA